MGGRTGRLSPNELTLRKRSSNIETHTHVHTAPLLRALGHRHGAQQLQSRDAQPVDVQTPPHKRARGWGSKARVAGWNSRWSCLA